jgi:predicted esterase
MLARSARCALVVCTISCGRASDGRLASAELVDVSPARSFSGDANESDATPNATDGAPPLTPLPSQPLFTNLTVPGFPEAVVSVPNGATSPRPVLVVLHGSGDRPDYNCDAWRHITGAFGFVLCPRGEFDPQASVKGDTRYTLRGGARLRAHVDAALDALAARYDGYVDIEQPIAVGFSLGATQIAQLAIAAPGRFPRVGLVEGGHGAWTESAIHSYAAGGIRRVLLGCGSTWCLAPAKAAAARLIQGGADARVVYANVGHTTDRALQEGLMSEIEWFLQGDARWSPPLESTQKRAPKREQ